MSAFTAFFASFLAAWPAPTGADRGVGDVQSAADAPVPERDPYEIWVRLARDFIPAEAAQVRIEQHFRWRIIPVPGPARESMMAVSPLPPAPPRVAERKMDKCIPMAAIVGGQTQRGSRLLLFLRDRRMVAADLEKACLARDFYSGFYVDKPNADGKLCVDRDRILARSGARCEISRFRLLVADD